MILVLGTGSELTPGLVRGLGAAGVEARGAVVDVGQRKEVRALVEAHRPQAVVLAAALEDAERAEAEPDRAFALNGEGPIHLALACLEFRAVAVLLSTAEVFGLSGGPWSEPDPPAPLSTWARTKLQGEGLLSRSQAPHLILRTGTLLSDGLLAERAALALGPRVEAQDERVGPLSAFEVGGLIALLLARGARGLFHLAGPPPHPTRAELWRALAQALGMPEEAVQARPGREIARKVAWGRAPVLLADKLRQMVGRSAPPWREAIEQAKAAAPVAGAETMGHKQDVRRVDKPWGHEIIWARTERYVGKVLFIKAGERLSLQYHEQKDETVYVLSGKMVFEVGPKDQPREDLIMKAGDSYHITPFTTHRMIALEDTHVLEASTPELDDVVRLEDKYGRTGTKAP